MNEEELKERLIDDKDPIGRLDEFEMDIMNSIISLVDRVADKLEDIKEEIDLDNPESLRDEDVALYGMYEAVQKNYHTFASYLGAKYQVKGYVTIDFTRGLVYELNEDDLEMIEKFRDSPSMDSEVKDNVVQMNNMKNNLVN